VLSEFRAELEGQVLGGPIEQWLDLGSAAGLERWLADEAHRHSDLGVFVAVARKHGFHLLGGGPRRFLSGGGWSLEPEGTWLRPGCHDGSPGPFDPGGIIEHCKHAWYGGPAQAAPSAGQSDPDPDRAGAYSWAKAPRYRERSAEVGPLARMVNDGDPLALDLLADPGPSVYLRVLMRWHETFRLIAQTARWLSEIDPEAPFYVKDEPRDTALAAGLCEAPRGLLGHWVRIDNGRIRSYQVVTPTGWNLSPRDSLDQPGPLEEALVGTPVEDHDNPVNICHVVQSFDPCLYCMVH
jgi:hydrogenase large subunit